MINYKQILEAVNRGIKFALDDFEDQDNIQGQTNSKVKYQSGTKEQLDLMNEVVDLGLPSGTLWCKYNLGVNPNQLSKAEDWYGDYYAWGEIEPKSYYGWITYKFGIDYNKLTKYCNGPNYGLHNFTDNLTELLPEDDAAYQNKKLYNFKFHIPTKEQFEELLKYTKNYWVNNYNSIQGLNGRVFTSKVNGNTLFIPAAGYRSSFDIDNVGSDCYLWSSSLYLGYFHCASHLNSISVYNYLRCIGYPVCPVINL